MSIAKKLQIREGQNIRIINPPIGLELDVPTSESGGGALLLFVKNSTSLTSLGKQVFDAAKQDRLAWIAYPKAGKLGTDLSRDKLVALARPFGIQPVRLVSLDDTWSAMRFRPA
ncbi:MAG TPA: hypothetical protein VLU91_04580 [Nitrososphaerales archaeon]|nr:hypothetical protein [Nitrososphaerales archaeon]